MGLVPDHWREIPFETLREGMVIGVMAMEDAPRQGVRLGDTRLVRLSKRPYPWTMTGHLLDDDRKYVDICYLFHEKEQWWFARQGEDQFRVVVSLMGVEPKEGE